MIKKFTLFFLFLLSVGLNAQQASIASPEIYNTLISKNYYLLYAIDQNKEIKDLLEKDDILNKIYRNRHQTISSSLLKSTETDSLNIYVDPYIFTSKEIFEISSKLEEFYEGSEKIRNFVQDDLKSSGNYKLYEDEGNKKLLSKAWELCAKGINHVLNTYGKGKSSRYAKIDSVSYNVKSEYYKRALYMWSDHLHSSNNESKGFYDEPMNFAISLLYLNHRDEAARYEPLEKLRNKAVSKNISDINFDNYKYSSILILGNGPENYMDRLSALGKLNIQLGVEKFRAGLAPLIIVSGGHAHPFRAQYCEAVEMKKELVEEYNVPEDKIVIDPHARHTTTNLRNATRLMIQYSIPISRPSIVVTNNSHSDYTGSSGFAQRCLEELGYLPGVIKKRLDATTLEFQPKIESLQQNPLDPLDP
ncbi:YdcF family protein [Salegentibacter agarivorans]